jgi:addiction module RelB/DinJ family antitoxin
MARTETIRALVEPELKSETGSILRELGLSSSEAVRLFLHQVISQRGLFKLARQWQWREYVPR